MTEASIAPEDRVFLVVVDETEEMKIALRFACRRALHTGGRVALLYVVEPADFQHWMTVGELMREEARSEGEQVLQRLAAQVNELAGKVPILHLREGNRADELMTLFEEEPSISVLVLGASTGKRGPGPLISSLTGKLLGQLHIPITLVPDSLTEEEIDGIS
ncbi:MAG: universal stress protein [Pseudomonadota bacterium]